nr:putative amidase pb8b6.03 [Quercus suber]
MTASSSETPQTTGFAIPRQEYQQSCMAASCDMCQRENVYKAMSRTSFVTTTERLQAGVSPLQHTQTLSFTSDLSCRYARPRLWRSAACKDLPAHTRAVRHRHNRCCGKDDESVHSDPLSQTCLAALYCLITIPFFYSHANTGLIIMAGIDVALLLAFVIVSVVLGRSLNFLDCVAIGDRTSAANAQSAFILSESLTSDIGRSGGISALSDWARTTHTNCLETKAIWGLTIVLCILLTCSALLLPTLWYKCRKVATPTKSVDVTDQDASAALPIRREPSPSTHRCCQREDSAWTTPQVGKGKRKRNTKSKARTNMIPPFDYLQHRAACYYYGKDELTFRGSKRKQDERAYLLASVSKAYQYPLSRTDKLILKQDIDELVQDIHERKKNAVDVLHAYGKVAIRAHEKTNCVTEVMLEQAEDWLKMGDINMQGPLAGVPISLKDSIQVGGFDTTVGYSVNVGKPADADGALVRLLKDAGAIPFVKTALPITLLSFESFNDVWGRCLNPHNPMYSPGGSTGGEGAILAFGGSRIGIGSDVAGSVRAPAHFSGCYSLRCSTGRWPKLGVSTSMPGQEGIPSVFSPMARTLLDLTFFTRSIVQMQPWKYDQSVHPIAWRDELESEYRERKSLKVGVMRTDTVVDPSPACARALDMATIALKEQGHEVFDVSIPDPLDAMVIASNLLNADGTKTFRSYFRTGESDDPGARAFGRYMRLPRFIKFFYWAYVRYVKRDKIWASLLEHWHEKSAHENWQWVAKREAYKAKVHEWWNTFGDKGDGLDIILTPPNATPALPHSAMKDACASCGYTFLFNLLDYTCGILPITHVDPAKDIMPYGFKTNKLNGIARGAYKYYDAVKMAGLPVAVQIVGRRLEEEKVLTCMKRLENALEVKGQKYELLAIPDA